MSLHRDMGPNALGGDGQAPLLKVYCWGPILIYTAVNMPFSCKNVTLNFLAQVARKWDGNSADKPVLDYSQKEDGEAAAGERQDISQPLADLSLKSRVDEFEDDEEGERISARGSQRAMVS